MAISTKSQTDLKHSSVFLRAPIALLKSATVTSVKNALEAVKEAISTTGMSEFFGTLSFLREEATALYTKRMIFFGKTHRTKISSFLESGIGHRENKISLLNRLRIQQYHIKIRR